MLRLSLIPLQQQKKTDQTISMAVKQEPLKHNQEFFFSSFRNLTTQLKVYTDQKHTE